MRHSTCPSALYRLTGRLASSRPAGMRLIAGVFIFAGIIVSARLLGFQIVSAQEAPDNAFTISPVPMMHVLQPGELPPAEAGRWHVDDSAMLVAGVPHAVSAGLQINATFDVSITSDPNAAAIEATINAAIANIESQFSDPITVNITFRTGGGLGSSRWHLVHPAVEHEFHVVCRVSVGHQYGYSGGRGLRR